MIELIMLCIVIVCQLYIIINIKTEIIPKRFLFRKDIYQELPQMFDQIREKKSIAEQPIWEDKVRSIYIPRTHKHNVYRKGDGYVFIPKNHPCYGLDINELYTQHKLNKYPKINFSGSYADAFGDNQIPGLNVKIKEYWVIGFRNEKKLDVKNIWTKEFIEHKVEILKCQLQSIYEKNTQYIKAISEACKADYSMYSNSVTLENKLKYMENDEIGVNLHDSNTITLHFKKNNKSICLSLSNLEKAIDEFTKNINFHYITKTEQNDKEKS